MRDVRADVVVVGAGPAGLAAAIASAEGNMSTVILDDNPAVGGQVWRGTAPPRARPWLERLERAHVQTLGGFAVVHATSARELFATSAKETVRVQGRRLVLACGARERLLPFPGWTLPGVMGAGGLQALVKHGFDVKGKRVLIAGTGPLLLAVAEKLRDAGARVVGVAEQTPMRKQLVFALRIDRARLKEGLELLRSLRGIPRWSSTWPVRAEGRDRVEKVTLNTGRTLDVDLLACGFGLVPNLRLAKLLGCATHAAGVVVDDNQRTSVENVFAAGEMTGIGGTGLALAEGQVAGFAAARLTGAIDTLTARRKRERAFAHTLDQCFALREELKSLADDDTLFCRCEAVPYSALRGFAQARDAKLLTRCGMGVCQGRVCGAAGEFLFGWSGDSARPPLFPVSMETLAAIGDHAERQESS